jgi:phospho-N-acetylmuramoyl-pentapeptide-transferase
VFRDKKEVRELADLDSSKKNVPTMRGFLILVPTLICFLVFAEMNYMTYTMLIYYICFSIVGFLDDYRKSVKKNAKGVSGYNKLVFQMVMTLFVVIVVACNNGWHSLGDIYRADA